MNRARLDLLRELLLRRGVSPTAVRRTLRELDDHREELRRRGRPVSAIGSTTQLARAVLARAPRSMVRMHPAIVFVGTPVIAWVLWIAGSLLLGGVVVAVGSPVSDVDVEMAVRLGACVLAVLYIAVGRAHRADWAWAACSVAQILLFLQLTVTDLHATSEQGLLVSIACRAPTGSLFLPIALSVVALLRVRGMSRPMRP